VNIIFIQLVFHFSFLILILIILPAFAQTNQEIDNTISWIIGSIIILVFVIGGYLAFKIFNKKSTKFKTSTMLDPEQLRAVQHPYDKPLAVTAGPGSGKTRVVAERVKDLILNQGVDKEKILCITFSGAAQKTMIDRLNEDSDLKNQGISFTKKTVSTFHSYCYDVLELKEYKTKQFDPVFVIKKTNDNDNDREYTNEMKGWINEFKKNFHNHSFKKFGIDDESINKLVDGVSAFKREDRTINDLDKYLQKNISKISDEYLEKLEDLLKYFKLYENYLKKLKKYDFDDFLQITVNEKLVKDSLEKEIKTVDHLIIDEFQDNNYLQFEISKLLTPTGHITVVGDKNQSVYSFQGANIENFSNFTSHYKKSTSIHLKHNYRSTPQIVDLSNKLLENKSDFSESTTNNESGNKVNVLEFCNEKNEYEFFKTLVCSKINTLLKKRNNLESQITFSDFLIIARTNDIRKKIKRYLVEHGIPCRTKEYTTIEYASRKTSKFLEKFMKLNSLNWKSNCSELLKKLKISLDEENYMYSVLYCLTQEFIEKNKNTTLNEFQKYLKEPQKYKHILNAVEISTAHSVKGKEFPFVIISNSHEGCFPLKFQERELKVPKELLRYSSTNSEEDLHKEEERRLYYVAITRAMYELYITFSEKDGNEIPLTISEFVQSLNYSNDKQNINYQKVCDGEVINHDKHDKKNNSESSKSNSISDLKTIETNREDYIRNQMSAGVDPEKAGKYWDLKYSKQ